VQLDRPDYSGLEAQQRAKLNAFRATRSANDAGAALVRVREAARDPAVNLLPVLIDAVKAAATLGEISDVLRAEWGVFRGVAA
jgi:methylmalonyl-CoA mutase N-terminal domain/subunit